MKQFATCHCHPLSLDSASKPEAFAKREVELGSGVITCTDHGTLAAAYQIYELGKKYKLTPVIGLEGYFRDDDCPILKKLGIPKTDTVPKGSGTKDEWLARYPNGTYHDYAKYFHVTLHFMDYKAYLCAVRLLSKADERAELHGQERKPLFTWSDLEELAAHRVTATSSCLVGVVQRHLMGRNNLDGAVAYFERMRHLFGDRFYTEVFPHTCTHDFIKGCFFEVETPDGKTETLRYHFDKKLKTEAGETTAEHLADTWEVNQKRHAHLLEVKDYHTWNAFDPPRRILKTTKTEGFVKNECRPWAPDGDVQAGCNRVVLELAEKYGTPVLIGDDSHFAHPEEKIVQDVRLAQGGPWRFHGSYHRQSTEEAWTHFRTTLGTPEVEFERWVETSLDWASHFKDFKFEVAPSLPTKFFPQQTLAHTKKLIEHHGRFVKDPRYTSRLKAEVDVLHRNGVIDLLPYFFIDEDKCRLYENQGETTGPGRGSAAGLLLSYLLGITHVDPLKYGLSLERFITTDRIKSGKMPDIDQDLPHRDWLVGMETDVLEIEMEDGTKHVLPEHIKLETNQGLMTPRAALEAGADIKPWWLLQNVG